MARKMKDDVDDTKTNERQALTTHLVDDDSVNDDDFGHQPHCLKKEPLGWLWTSQTLEKLLLH